MQCKEYGKTGDTVSVLGFGAMRFPKVKDRVYHLHALRGDVYRRQLGPGKILEQFRKARENGLIRHMCFSSHDKPESIKKLIDTGEFDGMLVQYNLLDWRNEEAIAYAYEKGPSGC